MATKKKASKGKGSAAKKKKLISVVDTTEPMESPPPKSSKWKKVTIKLTAQQVKELKSIGVRTSKVVITTYELSRLKTEMPN